MIYYTLNNDKLVLNTVEAFPQELEDLYQNIRRKYVINHDHSDWADNDRDAGWGYHYNNSYDLSREPERSELVICDGKLVGFYVGSSRYINKEYFLKLEDNAHIYISDSGSEFYCIFDRWTLRFEKEAVPFEYVVLMHVPHKSADFKFTPKYFDKKLVKRVYNQRIIEDNYGKFDGAFRVKLVLTDEGKMNPDSVLRTFEQFHPVIVKE